VRELTETQKEQLQKSYLIARLHLEDAMVLAGSVKYNAEMYRKLVSMIGKLRNLERDLGR